MEYDSELSLLLLAEPHPEVSSLPTWYPNLHSPGLIGGRQRGQIYTAGSQKTSPKKPRPSLYRIHCGVLQMRGSGVDTVRYVILKDWISAPKPSYSENQKVTLPTL